MEGTLGPGSWGLELGIWVSKEQDWGVSDHTAGRWTFWREKQPPAAFLNIRRNRSMSHMKGPQQPPGPKPPLTHKETHLQKVGCFFSKSEYQLGLLAGFWTHGPELFVLEHVNQLLHMKLGVKAILPKNKFKVYFWNSIGSGQEKKKISPRTVTPAGNCMVWGRLRLSKQYVSPTESWYHTQEHILIPTTAH